MFFWKTIHALRNKDESIYDKDTSFFQQDNGEDDNVSDRIISE